MLPTLFVPWKVEMGAPNQLLRRGWNKNSLPVGTEVIVEGYRVKNGKLGAMIFATGFAPFRGGPMHYARARGLANVRDELKRLAQKYGKRFQPDAGWDRIT